MGVKIEMVVFFKKDHCCVGDYEHLLKFFVYSIFKLLIQSIK